MEMKGSLCKESERIGTSLNEKIREITVMYSREEI